jgi:dihydrodipicolinate synthase/N-acetylneuraminate lyase
MENWKTHLILHFGTDNIKKPSEVAKKLEEIGFETSLGPVDFIHKWDKEPTKEHVLELADKVSEKLQGTGSVFNLDTHD